MRKGAFALALAGLSLWSSFGRPAEVWFGPNDNLRRGVHRDIVLNEDFPHLFDEKPQWSARIDTFQVTAAMAGPLGPQDELQRIGAFLKARHIKLAAGVQATLLDNPKPVAGECGVGVEGSGRSGQNALIYRRLKRLGLDITYASMDAPLFFGHYFNGKGACHYSIPDTARRAASAIAEIRQSYPDIRVVDFDSPPPIPVAQWRVDFKAWLDAYREAAGAPLDAIVFDVNLLGDWQARVAAGVAIAKREGVRAGIFVTKPGPGVSDAQAVADYKRGVAAIDASKIPFDIVLVANWTIHPFDNLPQSAPTTMTYVLDWYNRTHGRR